MQGCWRKQTGFLPLDAVPGFFLCLCLLKFHLQSLQKYDEGERERERNREAVKKTPVPACEYTMQCRPTCIRACIHHRQQGSLVSSSSVGASTGEPPTGARSRRLSARYIWTGTSMYVPGLACWPMLAALPCLAFVCVACLALAPPNFDLSWRLTGPGGAAPCAGCSQTVQWIPPPSRQHDRQAWPRCQWASTLACDGATTRCATRATLAVEGLCSAVWC